MTSVPRSPPTKQVRTRCPTRASRPAATPDTLSGAPLPHFSPHLAVAERGAPCPSVAVGPATAQVLVGDSAAIQIQVLVILRLWEFDSPRPHSRIPFSLSRFAGEGQGEGKPPSTALAS